MNVGRCMSAISQKSNNSFISDHPHACGENSMSLRFSDEERCSQDDRSKQGECGQTVAMKVRPKLRAEISRAIVLMAGICTIVTRTWLLS